MKLALEHAEHWVRNKSGMLRFGEMEFFNPFVGLGNQWTDGTMDAATVGGFGGAVAGLMGYLNS